MADFMTTVFAERNVHPVMQALWQPRLAQALGVDELSNDPAPVPDAEGELAARDSAPARTPATAAGLLADRTRAWLEEVREAGHVVHGPAEDLEPVVAGPGDPAPDATPPADLDPDEVVAMLRARAAGSDGGPARRPRWWRRG